MFFCVPIIFGCQTRLKPDGQQQSARICPRCHNVSVMAAKSTTWFELFWVPLIPFSRKHMWLCSICHWSLPITHGDNSGFQPTQGYDQNFQPGYAPTYVQQGPTKH
ncbi:hypothetical protein H2248_009622 [Termitomyces sp. 'cryptogamus']|nr:hypothetical protein H2248_009622 [Termitomyces sp. 'cryptogamus']